MSDPNDPTAELKRMMAYMQDQITKAEMLKHYTSPSSFILGVDPAARQSQANAYPLWKPPSPPGRWFLGVPVTYGFGDILRTEVSLPVNPVHYATLGLQTIASRLHKFPDPTVSNTLGWRSWFMDPLTGILRSPHMGTPWPDAECRCTDWPEGRDNVVRSHAGIHAYLVPHFWREAPTDHFEDCTVDNDWPSDVDEIEIPLIHGLIERYGRYVLGTDGWRAEWAIIRALHAPTSIVAMVLKHVYPDVEVTYTGQKETTDGHR